MNCNTGSRFFFQRELTRNLFFIWAFATEPVG